MSRKLVKFLFFALIYVMSILTSMVALKISAAIKVSKTIGLAISALLSTCFLFVVYYLAKMGSQSDGFTFEVTGPRRCDGGPYLWDAETAKHCSQYTQDELAGSLCKGGLYNGGPTHFEYTSLSNPDWQNDTGNGCYNNPDQPNNNNGAHAKGDKWTCGTGPHPF